MTEEARSVVKNNKLLQYPSRESMDTGTSERASEREKEEGVRERGGVEGRGRKEEREIHRKAARERTACTGNFSAGSFSSLFRARWMPVREGVINNDLMSSNNGHHGWFSWLAPSGGLREITRRSSCLLPFCARRYLPVSLLFFFLLLLYLLRLSTAANIHPRPRC